MKRYWIVLIDIDCGSWFMLTILDSERERERERKRERERDR